MRSGFRGWGDDRSRFSQLQQLGPTCGLYHGLIGIASSLPEAFAHVESLTSCPVEIDTYEIVANRRVLPLINFVCSISLRPFLYLILGSDMRKSLHCYCARSDRYKKKGVGIRAGPIWYEQIGPARTSSMLVPVLATAAIDTKLPCSRGYSHPPK